MGTGVAPPLGAPGIDFAKQNRPEAAMNKSSRRISPHKTTDNPYL
jgi:hypothetical protein